MGKLHRAAFFVKGSQINNKALVHFCLSLIDARKYLCSVRVRGADENRNIYIKCTTIFQPLEACYAMLSVNDEGDLVDRNIVIIPPCAEGRKRKTIDVLSILEIRLDFDTLRFYSYYY